MDRSIFDDEIHSFYEAGTFSETDKAAITCQFENDEMRGKFVVVRNRFIAFEIFPTNKNLEARTEWYERK